MTKKKETKKQKLDDSQLAHLGKLFEKYQKKMRLWDWNVMINTTIVKDDENLAYAVGINDLEKTFTFEITTEGYKQQNWDNLIIHELTHVLLFSLKKKYEDVIHSLEKQVAEHIDLQKESKSKVLKAQVALTEKWLLEEEEKICTQMESIFLGC